MKIRFEAEQPLGQALKRYWQRIQDSNYRGDRAELRRARDRGDILLLAAFQKAYSQFKPYFENEEDWLRSAGQMAAVMGLLAHVEKPSDSSIALLLAGKPKPKLSELRFRRLLQRKRTDLYRPMLRVLKKLKRQANIYDLADSVYYWGDKVKRRWAFDYFPNTPDSSSA